MSSSSILWASDTSASLNDHFLKMYSFVVNNYLCTFIYIYIYIKEMNYESSDPLFDRGTEAVGCNSRLEPNGY